MYAIHVEPTMAGIPSSTNAAGLVTAVSGLVGGDISRSNYRHCGK
ncbi:hypothetical protein PC129_g20008 [Phytophthora cactorum]|uniref:Uncharacterized protein n=1 Tax=Phytophthora cactorum TaxID=29920 RepID=A0A329SWJ7_9STRA|nr:hypothetical protein Pcac1_g12160 [Phytophthora cactorum]KAG2799082.1 hypothetical protein PC111_g20571 [Phytophthora cactorum]KAG2799140.1 hypothetical protein PC112_g21042 [Phytophthora cactorum]KAG2849512.1 hypothetical protein PC113_g17399 [Phytophthora cactorum]KAG2878155.1 hypothetical protein PC114_g23270 [Phytophthora cactorum]